MSLRFHTVSDEDSRDIEQEPLRLQLFHYGELLDPSLFDELEEDEKIAITEWSPGTQSEVLYIEAMFQSLHYLLTKETEWGKGAFPLNFFIGNRTDIGEIGWGKVTFYSSDDVKQISEALDQLNYVELEKRYDAGLFNQAEIYPSDYKWQENDHESLLTKLRETVAFMNETKHKGLGMYRVMV